MWFLFQVKNQTLESSIEELTSQISLLQAKEQQAQMSLRLKVSWNCNYISTEGYRVKSIQIINSSVIAVKFVQNI